MTAHRVGANGSSSNGLSALPGSDTPESGVVDITVVEPHAGVLAGVRDRIALGTAPLAVVGLGDRGLHLLLAAAEEGFPVIGIDGDARRVRALRDGRTYLREGQVAGGDSLANTRFATSAVAALAADVVIVAGGEVDHGAPEELVHEVAEGLRRGQLVVFDSTVDTRVAHRLRAALEQTGLKAGVDFGLAVSVGAPAADVGSPRILRASNELTATITEQLYGRLGPPVRAGAWAAAADAANDAASEHARHESCTPAERETLERLQQRDVAVTLVIPALNEAHGLERVLPAIPMLVNEVIIVDGGSTDDTLRVVGRLCPSAICIQQRGRGKGDAIKTGLGAATGEIVVTMDADGSMNPADIVPAVAALLDGCDFVKGSRALSGAGSDDFTPLHRLGNWALTAMSNALFGSGYTDITYGFNAYWRRVMLNTESLSDGFQFEIQAAIRASRSGLLTVEVPCFEAPRAGGESKLSPMRDGWAIARVLASEALPRSVTGFRAVADFYLPPTRRPDDARPPHALEAGADERRSQL